MRPSRPLVAAMLALVAAAAAGCTAEARSTDTPSPFADCQGLTGPSAPPAPTLPDLELPCFTGKEQVALRSMPGPMIINLWASWCDPCRRELPLIQKVATQTAGRVTVVGVDTGDSREAGASFAADKGVHLPTLFDPDKKLANAIAGTNLPITIFVDASGKSYVNRLPLDAAKLSTLVKQWTGMTVTP
ncbi:TlpA family protein disulfide reductase [Actinoplanes sp. KI2]|uniref:TlpA family protein disulfide reductase n=1 Tax=Actinoplanes sp. KI2 TaxID=2983315 RepID=UPI0021D5954C|nr:TlpA disulfide reductase family protein [Actinoplanes sp. KI2]MCU7722362.1 TlpA family protein disulfide reductase [Actinoplanes sp. KI2]